MTEAGNISSSEHMCENPGFTVYCPYGVCYPRERYSIFGVERQRKAVLHTGCGYSACKLLRLGIVLYRPSEHFGDNAVYYSYAAAVLCYLRPLAAEHSVSCNRGCVFGDTLLSCTGKSARNVTIKSRFLRCSL